MLGTIYDINTGSSENTCDGLTHPTYGVVSATYNAIRQDALTTFNVLTIVVSSVTLSNNGLVGTDIEDNLQT